MVERRADGGGSSSAGTASSNEFSPTSQEYNASLSPVTAANYQLWLNKIGAQRTSPTQLETQAQAQGQPKASGGAVRSAPQSDAGGFLHGATPGRGDKIETSAPGGSFVIPSDVVSGMGQGNSIAGAKKLEEKFGPIEAHVRGGYVEKGGSWDGPTLYRAAGGLAGGAERGRTPVMLSDGEYVVPDYQVTKYGHGDHKKGIRRAEHFVIQERRKNIARLKGLPGPVRSKE